MAARRARRSPRPPHRAPARRHHRGLRPRRRADGGRPRLQRPPVAQRGAVVRRQHRVRGPSDRPAADAVHAAGRNGARLAPYARAGSSCRSGSAPSASSRRRCSATSRWPASPPSSSSLTGIVALLGWLGYLAIRAFTREPPQRGLPVGDLLEQPLRSRRPAPPPAGAADRARAHLRPRRRPPSRPDAAVGVLRRRHPRLAQVPAVRRGDRPVPDLAGAHPGRHRALHRAPVRHPAAPALAARADAAVAHGRRHRQLHRDGGGLRLHGARRAARGVLCRLRHHLARHRRRRPVARHRLRPAVDRQQFRVGPDPADRAADQGRRPHRHRRPAGLRAPHQRARHRGRDLRPRQRDRSELGADHGPRASTGRTATGSAPSASRSASPTIPIPSR